MPERLERLTEEVATLKSGTEHLAAQVGNLTDSMNVVNEIYAQQQHIQAQQLATQAQVETVAETTATKEQLQQEQRERKRVHRASRINLALLTAVALIGSYCVWSYFDFKHSQAVFRQSTFSICQQRSAQANNVRVYLDRVSKQAIERARTPAERRQTRANFQLLREAFPPISCDRLKKGDKP